MYVFLDIETTGLDPVKDHILQLAMIVTTDELDPIGDPFVSDVALTEAAAGRLYMNPFVRDMHRKTGLLGRLEERIGEQLPPGKAVHYEYDEGEAAARGGQAPHWHLPLSKVEGAACEFLRNAKPDPYFKCTLAGNSVYFDLAFLRVHMPRLAAMCSHRIMDVSVLRMFEDRHGSGAIDVVNDLEHDALADCRCSIRQLHAYVERRERLKTAYALLAVRG